MDLLFWISYVILWITLLCTITALLSLYRYLGQRELNSREGRARQGPTYGRALPRSTVVDLAGRQLTLGGVGRPQLVYFASISCTNCADALPALSRFADRHVAAVESAMVCWGSMSESKRFAAQTSSDLRVIADPAWELGTKLRVSSTPFAVLTDATGVVRAKGSPRTDAEFSAFVEHVLPATPITFEPMKGGRVAAGTEGD